MSKYRALRVYQLTSGKTTTHAITNNVRLSSPRPNSWKKAREGRVKPWIQGALEQDTAESLPLTASPMPCPEWEFIRNQDGCGRAQKQPERTLPAAPKSVLIFRPDICRGQFTVIHEFLHAPVPLQNVRQGREQTAFNLLPV